MRRLLLLNTDLEIGGTPTVVRELAIRLRDAEAAQVEVACLGRRGPVADEIADAGIAVTALDARGATDLLVLRRLIRLISDRKIDTVLSFLVHANAIATAASLWLRDVRFFQSIQTTQPSPRWHWPVQGLAQWAAKRIIVPSESVAQVSREKAHVPAEKIVVIPNAIDVNEIAYKAGPRADTPTVGFIGRLDPVKRIPDLIDAMRQLNGVRCLIFGEGQQRAELEKQIAECGLGDRVILRGPTQGPAQALAQIDLLILPSEAEGFGLVLIEAMAAGVPVVATDAPGIRDVVRDGQTGLLVPVRAPNQLAAAIARVLNDSALMRRLVDAARTDVINRFSWETVIPRYVATLGL
ncbi:MAG TPA: glycosyltransferase family 4 protein [Tepidisphaeraceae bacterium]|nr:glycosyltransferase family 4 protein [Tepidisphaeraceae bacterium]